MNNNVIDFHSHVLPGVDDGSASVEMSIEMLRREAEQGVRHVVATPHFYAQHDTPEKFLRRRREAEDKLRAEMAKHSGLPELSIGAEVYFFHGISESDVLQKLAIDQKQCVLIEMPHSVWTEGMYQELADIRSKQGLIPILAHVDRYISPFKSYHIPERLSELPVIVQANAGFFLRRSTKAMALRMLKNGQIHLLGSDCHDLSDRAPNLGDAVSMIGHRLGQETIEQIHAFSAELLLASKE